MYFCSVFVKICGPGSSVGIATDYGLDGPGIEHRSRRIFHNGKIHSTQYDRTIEQKVHETNEYRTIKKKKNIPVGARFFAHVQTGPGAHPQWASGLSRG
jgi:hypothetical protein